MKKAVLILFSVFCLLFVSGCQKTPLRDVQGRNESFIATDGFPEFSSQDSNATLLDMQAYYKDAKENERWSVQFSKEDGFYSEDFSLSLSAEGAKDIFFTDDGSIPGPSSTRYSRPIQLAVTDATLPRCAVIRAVAYYADGTKSPVFTHTYFLNTKIKKRFSTPVFSIIAPPDELTAGPNALLVGKRALDLNENAKRDVLVQMFLSNGTEALNQPSTLRVYGNSSRNMSVKSLQLIAGTGAEAGKQSFVYSFFDTFNTQGIAMDHYSQLILSNSEEDFQYAFMRDELAQRLAKVALFQDYEDVQPAVVYINGEYYGLHWLHEYYSNNFFQAVYGVSEGRYAVIQWTEEAGASAIEQEDGKAAENFQTAYNQALSADFKSEEGAELVRQLIDVENYLDWCALNIVIDNVDWPARMQAYTFIPAEENAQPSPWRFLPHAMSNSFGNQGGKDAAKSDTIGAALNPESARFAPLFAKLMEVQEFQTYFVEKVTGLLDDKWSSDAMLSALKELHDARSSEMNHYLTRIEALRKTRNSGVTMKKNDFNTAYSSLTNYVKARPDAVLRQLEQHFFAEARK